ncbi:MAG TPA: hypothetical protein VGO10_16420 [Baekduia sp.]|nr:hypothetical protein [Baekduia sp.]
MRFDRSILRPVFAAQIVFYPRRRRPLPGWLGDVAKWRARVGMASIIVITIPYGGPLRIANDWWDGKLHHLAFGAPLLVAMIMAWRALMWRRIGRDEVPAIPLPVWRIVFLFTFAVSASATMSLLQSGMSTGPWWITVLCGAAIFWLCVFMIASFVLVLRFFFGIEDAHPMLAPICTVAIALVLFALRADGVVPHRVGLHIAEAGLASTAALCITEVVLLYRRGERLDRAPLPR